MGWQEVQLLVVVAQERQGERQVSQERVTLLMRVVEGQAEVQVLLKRYPVMQLEQVDLVSRQVRHGDMHV